LTPSAPKNKIFKNVFEIKIITDRKISFGLAVWVTEFMLLELLTGANIINYGVFAVIYGTQLSREVRIHGKFTGKFPGKFTS
jgi:hypothetical protein